MCRINSEMHDGGFCTFRKSEPARSADVSSISSTEWVDAVLHLEKEGKCNYELEDLIFVKKKLFYFVIFN